VKRAKCFGVFAIFMLLAPNIFSQQASVLPLTLKFAPEVINLVDSGSPTQAITVSNTGTADLVINSVLGSGGYLQTNDCSTVAPHQSCTIEVTFKPGTIGTLNGAITITDNTRSSPEVVSLSGKGIAPVQLSPGSLSFGTVPVGTTSQPQALTLTAAPAMTLSIDQVSVSGNFSQTNNCPSSLQGGKSCTISVFFQPTVNAIVQGALAVSTTGPQFTPLPFSVTLLGNGSGNVVSHVSVQPATLNFGNKGPDRADSVRNLTLTNTSSNTSLTIQSVSLAGSPNAVNAFPMYKINSNTCAGVLAPGAQCDIKIAFSTEFSRVFPQHYPGALTITDSDPTSPQVIGFSATQVGQLTFSPALLVFPAQTVGTTMTKTVTVTGNNVEGGILLTIAATGDFSETGDLSPCLLKQGGKCSMSVSFSPGRTGVINGSVTVETYAECSPDPRNLRHCPDPVVLNLSGTGK